MGLDPSGAGAQPTKTRTGETENEDAREGEMDAPTTQSIEIGRMFSVAHFALPEVNATRNDA
jgi:hypothetical protein